MKAMSSGYLGSKREMNEMTTRSSRCTFLIRPIILQIMTKIVVNAIRPWNLECL
jgi:hypothetical protein